MQKYTVTLTSKKSGLKIMKPFPMVPKNVEDIDMIFVLKLHHVLLYGEVQCEEMAWCDSERVYYSENLGLIADSFPDIHTLPEIVAAYKYAAEGKIRLKIKNEA